MQSDHDESVPSWSRNVLKAAALYNLAWGAYVIIAPAALFRWTGMADPRYPEIWQCVGMIVGVYGVGYWLAARDPFRHWPIVLVGLLGKILGPLGFLNAAIAGKLPWTWGLTILTNDLIWWGPFAAILYHAFRHNTDTSRGKPRLSFVRAVHDISSHRNASLLELSRRAPTLVVFLRHAGCTFCRESLADIERSLPEVERCGANIAIVHMGSPMDGTLMLQRRELPQAHHFSDPECALYRAFGLERGTLRQLFGPAVLLRALGAIVRGHGLGKLSGDGFRMPGAFLLADGRIVAAHVARNAADQPDLPGLLARANSNRLPAVANSRDAAPACY